ncbi:MAG: TolC family protein, partial [Novosphingobium sp.]|nr:TolC family protein [Novosphingobium sp.]
LAQTPPDLPVPVIPEEGLETLRGLVVSNSHEIAIAEAEAQRLSSKADRDRRDRIADPSVGLRVFSEKGGVEQGGGIVFSMPLGGGHRRALADQSAAEASAAQSEVQLTRTMVAETANADVAEARYRFAAWQQARASLKAQMTALAKQRRGHELGEIDLNDLLIGERLVHDAFRNETEARAEAMRAITKLRIDSHTLWLGD